MELAINFEQHKTVLISFTGEGYDPSQLDIEQLDSSVVSNVSNDNLSPSASSHLLTCSQVSCHSNMYLNNAHLVGSKVVTRNDRIWSFPIICYY